MGKQVKVLVAALAVAAVAAAPLSQAHAHDRGRPHHHGGWNGHKHKHHKRHRGPVVIQKNNDDALLLGVLGLAAGAIIAGAILSEPPNPAPRPNYYPQPDYYPQAPNDYSHSPNYYPPAPSSVNTSGTIEPWTDEWYRYCAQRYRSFDPATGTFRGYDGYDHFCVAR
ncbi:BA14K family protein [Nitratireductor sp. XY-223]|uniref:BA14K family protein n=1 Tax=Nitratireductor sp. XY-223 TaxID=2561926 RepID=UPI0010AAA3AF|nr:BA14K family protein [Nitratireductor sp. XY-223]